MTRPVSASTLAQASAGAAAPLYFVEILWPTFSSRLCTFGDLSWNGGDWHGAGVEVGDFDDQGTPSRLTLADPDYIYRTLVFAEGIRDRRVMIWKAYADALDADDPIGIFDGVADSARYARGRLEVRLGRNGSAYDQTPRERIAPAFGFNWLAPPGTKVPWYGSTLVLNPRTR
jgi:hypothetical protein